jgi:hypothetical protein
LAFSGSVIASINYLNAGVEFENAGMGNLQNVFVAFGLAGSRRGCHYDNHRLLFTDPEPTIKLKTR